MRFASAAVILCSTFSGSILSSICHEAEQPMAYANPHACVLSSKWGPVVPDGRHERIVHGHGDDLQWLIRPVRGTICTLEDERLCLQMIDDRESGRGIILGKLADGDDVPDDMAFRMVTQPQGLRVRSRGEPDLCLTASSPHSPLVMLPEFDSAEQLFVRTKVASAADLYHRTAMLVQ
jgi:hypothetical protein